MKRQLHKLLVADHAASVLRNLHPDIKKKLKTVFQAIAADPYAGKALTEELDGLRSYRVSRFRIIYRVMQERRIEIIAVGPRERIYEETYRLVSKSEK
ncbi:MAG: type II toxin-antitoxin system RelE/ParE family toxin [Nitrospirota bacterium]